jgi:hypothetical protein
MARASTSGTPSCTRMSSRPDCHTSQLPASVSARVAERGLGYPYASTSVRGLAGAASIGIHVGFSACQRRERRGATTNPSSTLCMVVVCTCTASSLFVGAAPPRGVRGDASSDSEKMSSRTLSDVRSALKKTARSQRGAVRGRGQGRAFREGNVDADVDHRVRECKLRKGSSSVVSTERAKNAYGSKDSACDKAEHNRKSAE